MLLAAALAKLTALGLGAKVAVATATTAGVVAAGAATGVVPVLPEQADRPAAEEQVVQTSQLDEENVGVTEVPQNEEGTPAEQAEFGQATATDARDGGVNGRDIAEQRSNRELPEQATAGQEKAAEKRTAGQEKGAEGRTTGETKAAEGQANRDAAPADETNGEEPAGDSSTGEERSGAGAGNGDAARNGAGTADDETDE